MHTTKLLSKKTLAGIFIVFLFVPAGAQINNPVYCEVCPPWEQVKISDEKTLSGVSKIFIITNRPYVADAKGFEFFPNDIANYRKVSYLIASCDGQSWQLRFVSSFEEGMQEINDGRDILLFIEGHGKTLPMALNRAFQVQERYNVALMVFDWPSKNRNFNSSLARVRRCGDNFYNLLLQVRDYRKIYMDENQRFSILAHSLGNYFLSHLIVCGDSQYLNDVFVDNVVFNAAAIRSREHGEALSRINFARRLYITYNKYDWVLRGANILTSGKMLGNVVIPPLAAHASYINFTGIVGKEHSYYYGHHTFENSNPVFFNFYNTVVHGMEINQSDIDAFVGEVK